MLALQLQTASISLDAITPQAEAAIVMPLPETFKADVALSGPPDDLQAFATKVAKKHGLNVNHFLNVIQCESHWKPDAVGDNGTSFGLAQLHNPVTDWGITAEQAKDPEIALPIMAKAWQEGKERKWSCWRIYYD